MRSLTAACVLLLVAPAAAQAPSIALATPDVARVKAGRYHIEPDHTQILFAVDHLGLSTFRGFLSQASGSLTLDPANPAAARLEVTVPVRSIWTSSSRLDQELVSPDWFDVARFPDARFVATRLSPRADQTALVDGNLTLHGVTRPVQMRVHFHGAGANPMSKAASLGFDGHMTISRSAFGIAKYVPLVSDAVELTIAAAFEQ